MSSGVRRVLRPCSPLPDHRLVLDSSVGAHLQHQILRILDGEANREPRLATFEEFRLRWAHKLLLRVEDLWCLSVAGLHRGVEENRVESLSALVMSRKVNCWPNVDGHIRDADHHS